MERIIGGLITTALLVVALTTSAMAADVRLAAAASLRDVLNELTDTFGKTNPGTVFVKNYGASGSLAKQIANGAPADLFISANSEWITYLRPRNLLNDRSIVPLAYNELVFVGRHGLAATRMTDLTRLASIAIGSPKSVPAGEYAMEAVRKAGIEGQVTKKLVMAKDVRECLLYAVRGEVDGAFVYRTDALQAGTSAALLFTVPQALYPRVTYPMALTNSGTNNPTALSFYRFLQSPTAKRILAKHDFPVR